MYDTAEEMAKRLLVEFYETADNTAIIEFMQKFFIKRIR